MHAAEVWRTLVSRPGLAEGMASAIRELYSIRPGVRPPTAEDWDGMGFPLLGAEGASFDLRLGARFGFRVPEGSSWRPGVVELLPGSPARLRLALHGSRAVEALVQGPMEDLRIESPSGVVVLTVVGDPTSGAPGLRLGLSRR